MAVLDNASTTSKSAKSVFLLTVSLRNTFVPAYQPKLQAVKIVKLTGPETYKTFLFEADLASRSESNLASVGSSYLLRMEIEPGDYIIMGLNSYGQSMMINGEFFTPIGTRLRVSAATPGICYLGHVEAIVRERKGDEFRAGPYLPMQEQKLTGASGGTFDIAITDQWETDSVKFQNKFPALKTATVQKAVLPPFNPDRIQRWWAKNVFNELP